MQKKALRQVDESAQQATEGNKYTMFCCQWYENRKTYKNTPIFKA